MSANTRFTPAALQPYLRALHGGAVHRVRVTALGGGRQGDKGYGYGIPLRVDYCLRAGEKILPLDFERADALCDYLVDIHRIAGPDPGLYARRIRELIGHGECIFGVADSYPQDGPVPFDLLEQRSSANASSGAGGLNHAQTACARCTAISIRGTSCFALAPISRSSTARAASGEPAADVTYLALNYLFFSLQRCGTLEGDFERLWLRFWERYLERSGDRGMLEVAAPFLAFRGLVMANPVWYPALDERLRRKLLSFVRNVLEDARFDPARANAYCEA